MYLERKGGFNFPMSPVQVTLSCKNLRNDLRQLCADEQSRKISCSEQIRIWTSRNYQRYELSTYCAECLFPRFWNANFKLRLKSKAKRPKIGNCFLLYGKKSIIFLEQVVILLSGFDHVCLVYPGDTAKHGRKTTTDQTPLLCVDVMI